MLLLPFIDHESEPSAVNKLPVWKWWILYFRRKVIQAHRVNLPYSKVHIMAVLVSRAEANGHLEDAEWASALGQALRWGCHGASGRTCFQRMHRTEAEAQTNVVPMPQKRRLNLWEGERHFWDLHTTRHILIEAGPLSCFSSHSSLWLCIDSWISAVFIQVEQSSWGIFCRTNS